MSIQLSLASGLLICGTISFIFYMIVLLLSNSMLDKQDKNRFRNSFPYQFYAKSSMPMRVMMYVMLLVSVCFTCCGEFFLLFASRMTVISIMIAILLPISLILLFISNILSLVHAKSHIITSTISFFTFSLACILFALTTFIPSVDTLYISRVISIIVGVIGLIALISLINPKLSNWAKMEKAEIDGKTVYVKPKINYYALYEWIFLILMEIVALLLFIDIFVTGSVSLK